MICVFFITACPPKSGYFIKFPFCKAVTHKDLTICYTHVIVSRKVVAQPLSWCSFLCWVDRSNLKLNSLFKVTSRLTVQVLNRESYERVLGTPTIWPRAYTKYISWNYMDQRSPSRYSNQHFLKENLRIIKHNQTRKYISG